MASIEVLHLLHEMLLAMLLSLCQHCRALGAQTLVRFAVLLQVCCNKRSLLHSISPVVAAFGPI